VIPGWVLRAKHKVAISIPSDDISHAHLLAGAQLACEQAKCQPHAFHCIVFYTHYAFMKVTNWVLSMITSPSYATMQNVHDTSHTSPASIIVEDVGILSVTNTLPTSFLLIKTQITTQTVLQNEAVSTAIKTFSDGGSHGLVAPIARVHMETSLSPQPSIAQRSRAH